MGPLLLNALTGLPLARCSELLGMGITRRQIQYGLDTGHVLAPVPGIYCLRSTEQTTDPLEFEMALGHRCSGGVVCGATAARWHDLTDHLPDQMELLVPREYTSVPAGKPWILRRTDKEAGFSVGVFYEDIMGVRVPVTDRARTVLDLYRWNESRQHCLAALDKYLSLHGTVSTLSSYAKQLSLGGYRVSPRWIQDAESILVAKERPTP